MGRDLRESDGRGPLGGGGDIRKFPRSAYPSWVSEWDAHKGQGENVIIVNGNAEIYCRH